MRLRQKRVKVIHAEITCGGQSIYPPYVPLGCSWCLQLEDGTTVYRRVHYKPDPEFKPGWFKRRSPDDALPPPKFVYKKYRKTHET